MSRLEMLLPLIDWAGAQRAPLMDDRHASAFRLFNGFSEGFPDLTVEVYGQTLVLHDYSDDPAGSGGLVEAVAAHISGKYPWLRAGLRKARHARSPAQRNGSLLFGREPDRRILENGIWYALDLTLNRDTSFYLDTRLLRQWLTEHMRGRSVLNTFAYTGSLGVAARAGGAARVVQHDLNRRCLDLAKMSYELNGYSIQSSDFITADFFPTVAQLKRTRQTFDCVILDPPFFSVTPKGKVDQEQQSARLINKVRPLVSDGGYLVAINNAIYVSGQQYLQTLEALCADGYLKIEELIPVPPDCTGYELVNAPLTDPAPFNHATKIAILRVRRKAG